MNVTPFEILEAIDGYYNHTLGGMALAAFGKEDKKPGHWDLSDPKQKEQLDAIIRNANKKK